MKPQRVVYRATIVGKRVDGWWIFKQNILTVKIIGIKEPTGLVLTKGLGTYVDVPVSYGFYCEAKIGDTITIPAELDENGLYYQIV